MGLEREEVDGLAERRCANGTLDCLVSHAHARSLCVTERMKSGLSEQAEATFDTTWKALQREIHRNAVEKGFWDLERNNGEAIALMHSELSEALEAMRHGNPPAEHITGSTSVEEELADVVIRIMDFAEARGLDLPRAIVDKMVFNAKRPHKHGKKF